MSQLRTCVRTILAYGSKHARRLPVTTRIYQNNYCTAASKPQTKVQPIQAKDSPDSTKSTSPLNALGYELGDGSLPVDQRVGGQRAVIDAIGPSGFTINGVRVSGSVLVMPFFSTFWNIEELKDITPDSFALVKLIFPRPDMVILGTGKKIVPISRELRELFKSIDVRFEAMDTMNACQTFNILNQEGRLPAVALLPHGHEE